MWHIFCAISIIEKCKDESISLPGIRRRMLVENQSTPEATHLNNRNPLD
jgi:hypothetical protein